jgi:hypothetical protein
VPAILQPRGHENAEGQVSEGAQSAPPAAPVAAQADRLDRAVSRLPIGPGHPLWNDLLNGKDSKWTLEPHPWTSLRNFLIAHAVKGGLPIQQVDGLTTNLYYAKFHTYPAHVKALKEGNKA